MITIRTLPYFLYPLILSAICVAQPVDIPEVEPNDTKATATPADRGGPGLRAFPPPLDTDRMLGTSNGEGSGGNLGSVDYFLLKSGDEPKNLYCYYLEESVGSEARMSLRGLVQSAGNIIPFTDVAVQSPVTTPVKTIWYGVGAQERLYFRIAGRATGPTSYSLDYRCEPYPPALPDPGNPDTWPTGSITLRASGPNGLDMDLWVYDDNLEPIPGYGHDDPDISGLTRQFGPGTYYVALTDGNLLNNLASPLSDANRNKPVMDFPDIIASGSDVAPINGIQLQVSGGGVAGVFTLNKVHAWQVFFCRIHVVDPNVCPVCSADFNQDGGVDGLDVQAFFVDWSGGTVCADVNGDGGIDGSDVQVFFDIWTGGGC